MLSTKIENIFLISRHVNALVLRPFLVDERIFNFNEIEANAQGLGLREDNTDFEKIQLVTF